MVVETVHLNEETGHLLTISLLSSPTTFCCCCCMPSYQRNMYEPSVNLRSTKGSSGKSARGCVSA